VRLRSFKNLLPVLLKVLPSILIAFLLSPASSILAQTRYGVPIQVEVPVAPIPFKANNKYHLAYELHVTNFRSPELTLMRVDVLSGATSMQPLASYAEKELTDSLSRPGISPDIPDKRVIGGGLRAVIFIWLTIDKPASIPPSFRHRLVFKAPDSEKELTLETAQVSVRQDRPVVIGAPLAEGMWVAARGPSNVSGHRRALIPTDGRAYIAQRFAVDLMKVGMDRRVMPENHLSKNESWYGYGAEVIAVADGVVADVRDGIPDNVPLSPERAVPITSETVGGNYVMLRLAEGWYAFYAHLQPGSLRVKPGDRVRKGQVLGRLGNSGNSDAPHLHFHIASAASPLGAEGLPFAFESFAVLGIEAFDPQKKSAGERRAFEMPLENELIRFK
jgi:hypothetical protein